LIHTQYFQDIRSQFAAYAHPIASLGTLAGSLTYLRVGSFEGYDAEGQPAGSVDAQDSALSLSYARPVYKNRRLGSQFAAGITGKWIRETLDTVTASAYAADLGLYYAPGRILGESLEGVRAGLVARNLGTSLKFDQDSYDLPRSLSAGFSWKGVWLGESLTLTLDGSQPTDGHRTFSAGAELWTLRLFALRAGYTSAGDLGSGLRAGGGIRLRTLQVDYAFTGAGDFGSVHRIGLTLHFGTTSPDPQGVAQEWFDKGHKEFRKKHYSEALVDFNKALEVDPTHPEAFPMMKKAYENLKTIQAQ
jgi:hypothetical protein